MWVWASKDLDVKEVGGVICKESLEVGFYGCNILCERWSGKGKSRGWTSVHKTSKPCGGQVSTRGVARW